MATFAMVDCRLEINSVVLSASAKSVTLSVEVDELEDTAFGDLWKSRIGGLKDWEIEIEWNQDFAAGNIDATIWPLLGTATNVKARPTSAAIAATNPEFSGSALVKEYSPLDGSVGDLATVSTSWPGAGTLARATS